MHAVIGMECTYIGVYVYISRSQVTYVTHFVSLSVGTCAAEHPVLAVTAFVNIHFNVRL
jgi:hypothetical protein